MINDDSMIEASCDQVTLKKAFSICRGGGLFIQSCMVVATIVWHAAVVKGLCGHHLK
jgi:hypothetical protein